MLNQAQVSGIYFVFSLGVLLHPTAWIGHWINNKKKLSGWTQSSEWKRWRIYQVVFVTVGVLLGLLSALQSTNFPVAILFLTVGCLVEVALWTIIYFLASAISGKGTKRA